MQTRYHLATLKKGNSTISEYFHKAKTYSDLLASIGQPLSNNDIVTYLLAGLPSDYDSLIVTVTMRLKDFPLDDLYGHLLTHELQLEQQATVPDLGLPTANLATTPSSPNQPHHPFTNFHGCGNNGGRGHGKGHFSCGLGNNGSYSNTSSSRSFYQICLKVGHTAPTCWHRFEQNYQAQPGQSQAFVAATSSSVDPIWYPDTGANNHLTSDLSNLNLNVENYNGQDQVHISNGQGLHIHHIGSSILCSSSHDFFLKNILHVPHISQNLLSIHQFAKDNNVFFEFHPSFFYVKDLFSGAILLSDKSKDGLHKIKPRAFLGERVSLNQWHAPLGHPALRVVRQILSQHHLAISTNKSPPVCHAC